MTRVHAVEEAPTDGLGRLAASAAAVKIAASALRFLAAGAVSFAGLLVVALLLSSFDRTGAREPAQTSASAYLDFDLAVLRALADRGLAPSSPAEAERGALGLWAQRPDWQLPGMSGATPRLVGPGEAWAAVVSERSHFRTAARGAASALPFLLAALAISLLAAAFAAVLARARDLFPGRSRRIALAAATAGLCALVVYPLLPLFNSNLFYDRTRSLGLGVAAVLFVAAFAGAMPGAAARAYLANHPHAQHLADLGGRRSLFTIARLAALDAVEWLLPLVPALAAAAVFVCAKEDQDPASSGNASGLGALIRAAMSEPSVAERIGSCALVAGALVVLWYLGHRFLLEARESLGAQRSAP
ncbi:MAG: hypothetical protein E6J62_05115 [Deltaproteobacteria bacterium]|nr:MAG: hypothetical protein E6J85_08355 [Deltaproteobacteria bacterium]TMB37504.1 MAG: hypothetical protein E6J62_05115 [Deltaproteobacteria bacterium]